MRRAAALYNRKNFGLSNKVVPFNPIHHLRLNSWHLYLPRNSGSSLDSRSFVRLLLECFLNLTAHAVSSVAIKLKRSGTQWKAELFGHLIRYPIIPLDLLVWQRCLVIVARLPVQAPLGCPKQVIPILLLPSGPIQACRSASFPETLDLRSVEQELDLFLVLPRSKCLLAQNHGRIRQDEESLRKISLQVWAE